MSEVHHSIKVVSKRTGLSPHVIRVWEKRYGAVKPTRTETNRRSYSEEEIRRLGLLHEATRAGHSIGNVARLPTETLIRLVSESTPPSTAHEENRGEEQFIADSVEAIRRCDAAGFEQLLTKATLSLGQHGVLERVIGPLACKVGNLWQDGSLTAAHEHFATAVIRNFLGRKPMPFALPATAPTLLVTTPAGQLHELGAVMVAAAASDVGWKVIYLGPSLPAIEIASAAVQNKASIVALSIVYPQDDPNLPEELVKLRRFLPNPVKIMAGGRAAAAYGDTLQKIGAMKVEKLKEIYGHLDSIRSLGSRTVD